MGVDIHHGRRDPGSNVQSLRQQFIEFALQAGVLRFGEFKTKAGRLSPYFFNAGLFNRGALLGRLARFYAQTLLTARILPGRFLQQVIRLAMGIPRHGGLKGRAPA